MEPGGWVGRWANKLPPGQVEPGGWLGGWVGERLVHPCKPENGGQPENGGLDGVVTIARRECAVQC